MPLLMKRPIATLFIDAEPPERATYGGRMARNRRFQHGSLFKRGTRTKVWVARWWEDVSGREGKLERVRRSESRYSGGRQIHSSPKAGWCDEESVGTRNRRSTAM